MTKKGSGIRCPECGELESYVRDSRHTLLKGTSIPARRRRHECLWCDHRWTTYEVEEKEIKRLLGLAKVASL